MFHRSHIGISWSPDALTVAMRPTRRSARHLCRLMRVPLKRGDIDPASGRIVREQALRSALEEVPDLAAQSSGVASLSMAIPSGATYVHTWTVASSSQVYSHKELLQQVEKVFPGKSDELIFDIHQCWNPLRGITRAMLVIVNRDVVLGYARLLGARVSFLERISTAEVMRYNLCCLIEPKFCDTPSVVVYANPDYVEVTAWSDGVIRCSRRAVLVDMSMLSPKDNTESIGATDDAKLREPGVVELGAALSSVLSHFTEAERGSSRIVVFPNTALAKVKRALHSLSLHQIPVDCFSLSESRAEMRYGGPLLAELKIDACEGSEDALGMLLTDPSRYSLVRGKGVGVLGSVCNMWSSMRQRCSAPRRGARSVTP